MLALPSSRCSYFLISEAFAAYNAALTHPDPTRRDPHGRTFPVQEHHAPQGPAGRPEVKAVLKTGAGNHRRRQDGPARSVDERAAARRDHLGTAGEHVE